MAKLLTQKDFANYIPLSHHNHSSKKIKYNRFFLNPELNCFETTVTFIKLTKSLPSLVMIYEKPLDCLKFCNRGH